MVRRHACRLDVLCIILPITTRLRLCVLTCNSNSPTYSAPSSYSPLAHRRLSDPDDRSGADLAFANHARRFVEAAQSRLPSPANLSSALRRHRVALLYSFHHWSPASGLVRASAPWRFAVPAVCAVQHRIDPRPGDLSVPCRASTQLKNAIDLVVDSLRHIRGRRPAMRP